MEKKDYRLLLVGNPNCGKSSLFNRLTGLNQKTGNFSGVTVEKLSGTIKNSSDELEIIDLPGSFSLNGSSEEKKTLTRFLMQRKSSDRIVFVLDALLLERSLQFLFQIMDLGAPIILVLTMKDLLEKRNISIDLEKLKKILGLEIVFINAKSGEGVEKLKAKLFEENSFRISDRIWSFGKKEESFIKSICESINSENPKFIEFVILNSLKKLSGENLQKELPGLEIFPQSVQNQILQKFQTEQILFRYQDELIHKSFKIKEIISEVVQAKEKNESYASHKLDRFLLDPIWGIFSFLLIMALLFQTLFSWVEVPMDMIENGFDFFANLASSYLPTGPFAQLVSEGAIKGVGSVMVFIPQIALLFFFIGLMEESGYMARASFVMDRFMGRFGLSGKSFIPLLSSAACAVPAILGSRSIEDKSDRMRTILVSPLITCSARYPVYLLVIGSIFPSKTWLGFITLKAVVLFALFLLGMITALVFALLFKKTFFKQDSSYFIMELPSYKLPSLKNVSLNTYKKVKDFVVNSGQVILFASIFLWFLANYPYKEIPPESSPQTILQFKESQIKNSYAAMIGKWIEPAIEPLGFDWKIGISLITSFAAREVMVSTLAIIYGVNEDSDDLEEVLKKDINPKTGKPVWTILSATSVLIFFAFACQCMSTLAVIRKETNSYMWPAFVFGYMSILAYISSFLVYQIGNMVLG